MLSYGHTVYVGSAFNMILGQVTTLVLQPSESNIRSCEHLAFRVAYYRSEQVTSLVLKTKDNRSQQIEVPEG